jgi:carboxylesterase
MVTANPSARGLGARPNPAESFAEACERAASFDAAALQPLSAQGRSRLLVGDGPAEEAIVLFHGLTNCPYQMRDLAATLHARGHAVFVPRLPRHGYTDRRHNGLERLTAEELRDCCDAAVDIAMGLGKRVAVAGISAGGVMAAWVAQFRPEVAQATLIAPAFAFGGRFGVTLGKIQEPLLLMLPNFDISRFDERRVVILDHAYYNFPSRALGQVLRLGSTVWRAAARKPPLVPKVHVLINAADDAVNDDVTQALVARWRRVGYQGADMYEFPASLRLIHDIIDPSQREQQTALTYPILLSAIG